MFEFIYIYSIIHNKEYIYIYRPTNSEKHLEPGFEKSSRLSMTRSHACMHGRSAIRHPGADEQLSGTPAKSMYITHHRFTISTPPSVCKLYIYLVLGETT